MTLEQVVAHIFRKKGKVTSISEFVFALSLDLKWFSPDQAESVLANAEQRELVRITGEVVEPLFDIHSVEIPVDFRPDQSILYRQERSIDATATKDEVLLKETKEASDESAIIDRVVEQLSGVKSKQEVIRLINDAHERLGIVETDAVALLVARTCSIDVSGMIDEVYDRLVRPKT
ncbi:MAG TPA: DUF2240 family protein [Methanosarcinales archaeon]|nr:MAG: hypothetical protein DRO03_00125 [Methanosarcinales archaeon]HDN65574.1 DUF2240 family protein [Methanosarcinales archaeon]